MMRVGISPNVQPHAALAPSGKGKSAALVMVGGQNDRMAGSVPVFQENSFTANFADQDSAPSSQAMGLNESKIPVEPKAHDFGFKDFLDVINPLQHIPVVSTIYQHLTGDTIAPVAEIVGGGLFGGPIGAAASLASVAVKSAISEHPSESDKTMSFQHVMDKLSPLTQDTTIALADLRQGYMPYNG